MSEHGHGHAHINWNIWIRTVGVYVALFIMIRFVPGFHTYDLFTLLVLPLLVMLLELPLRGFLSLQTFHLTPVTMGVPMFIVSFILLSVMSVAFPGFHAGFWVIILASFVLGIIHYVAEWWVHGPYH